MDSQEPNMKLWGIAGIVLSVSGLVAVLVYARAAGFDPLLGVIAALMAIGLAATLVGLIAYLRDRR